MEDGYGCVGSNLFGKAYNSPQKMYLAAFKFCHAKKILENYCCYYCLFFYC